MRSWILIPAENDKAIGAAAGTGADAVVIDLARPLPPGLKAAARVACMEWLRAYRDQRQSEHKFARWARIPALDSATWREDLATAMAGSPHGIVLSQCHGPEDLRQLAAALDAIETGRLTQFLPFHAVRADLLASTGRLSEARAEYDAALALDPEPAEARLLVARRDALGS